jgi:alpha-glucosidase
MKKYRLFFAFVFCFAGCVFADGSLESPGGRTSCVFGIRDGVAEIRVSCAGRLTATVQTGFGWSGSAQAVTSRVWRSSWRPVWGGRTNVVDSCAEKVFALKDAAGRRIELDLRAYDEGVAFRCRLPEGGAFDERTRVAYPEGAKAWAIERTEDAYPAEPCAIVAGAREWMTPLTVFSDGVYSSFFEAYALSYPRMRTVPFDGGVSVKLLQKEVPVLAPGGATPWRVLQLAQSPRELIDNATLVLNLNPPCAIEDVSWIRPGLSISNLSNCKLKTVDLVAAAAAEAAATGAIYFQLDWGWYGTEWGWSDADRARFVKTNPSMAGEPTWRANTAGNARRTAKGVVPYLPGWQRQFDIDLDFDSLIPSLRSHGISLCLYVRGKVLEGENLDSLFALYRSWGVAGVKPGFVRYGSAADTDWNRELVRIAARHRLWVDIHDEAVPDGSQRTYPNLFLMEGVGGEEGKHPVRQDVSIPFARGLVGPFDYTPMVFTEGRSHTHVTAMFLCYPGPTSVMRGSSLARQRLSGEVSSFAWGSEVSFLKSLAWTWDESRVLDAEIGKKLVVARRSGDAWFLAGLSGENEERTEIDCGFLVPGERYRMTLWQDDMQDATPCRRSCESRRIVTSSCRIPVAMAPGGGVLATFRRIPRQEEMTDEYFKRKCMESIEPEFHLAGGSETTNAFDTVTVYTNVGEVMFRLNGRFVGAQVPNAEKTCSWRNVPLSPGENTLEFRAGQITRRLKRIRR